MKRVVRLAICFTAAAMNLIIGAILAAAAIKGTFTIDDEVAIAMPLIMAAAFLVQGAYWLFKEPGR